MTRAIGFVVVTLFIASTAGLACTQCNGTAPPPPPEPPVVVTVGDSSPQVNAACSNLIALGCQTDGGSCPAGFNILLARGDSPVNFPCMIDAGTKQIANQCPGAQGMCNSKYGVRGSATPSTIATRSRSLRSRQQ